MQANEYQQCALRTAHGEWSDLVENCALGICGETGEVVKVTMSRGNHKEQIINELGDCAWYVAVMADTLGMVLEDIEPQERYMGVSLNMAITNMVICAGEIADHVKKYRFQKHGFIPAQIISHLRAFLASVNDVCGVYGLSLNQVYKSNVEKLLRRYPDAEGFSPERSIHREA